MENVTEDTVVDEIFLRFVWLDDVTGIVVEKAKLASEICTDGSRTDAVGFKASPEHVDDI